MSELEADMKFSAAAYLHDYAAKAKTPEKVAAALTQAADETRTALAEARIPDNARQPTFNTCEAPPLNADHKPRLRR